MLKKRIHHRHQIKNYQPPQLIPIVAHDKSDLPFRPRTANAPTHYRIQKWGNTRRITKSKINPSMNQVPKARVLMNACGAK